MEYNGVVRLRHQTEHGSNALKSRLPTVCFLVDSRSKVIESSTDRENAGGLPRGFRYPTIGAPTKGTE